jgi:hypothetical protein
LIAPVCNQVVGLVAQAERQLFLFPPWLSFLIADLIIVARRNSSNELNKGERLSAFAFAASCSLSLSLSLVTARAVRWVIHCQRAADIKWPSARNTLSGIDITALVSGIWNGERDHKTRRARIKITHTCRPTPHYGA